MVDRRTLYPRTGHEYRGRPKFFKRFSPADSTGIIINEAVVRLAGLTHPIGTKFYTLDDIKTKKLLTYHVVGVVKDFNFNSLREVVSPLAFFLQRAKDRIALRVRTDHVERLIAPGRGQLAESWRRGNLSATLVSWTMYSQFPLPVGTTDGEAFPCPFSLLAIFIACHWGLFRAGGLCGRAVTIAHAGDRDPKGAQAHLVTGIILPCCPGISC